MSLKTSCVLPISHWLFDFFLLFFLWDSRSLFSWLFCSQECSFMTLLGAITFHVIRRWVSFSLRISVNNGVILIFFQWLKIVKPQPSHWQLIIQHGHIILLLLHKDLMEISIIISFSLNLVWSQPATLVTIKTITVCFSRVALEDKTTSCFVLRAQLSHKLQWTWVPLLTEGFLAVWDKQHLLTVNCF